MRKSLKEWCDTSQTTTTGALVILGFALGLLNIIVMSTVHYGRYFIYCTVRVGTVIIFLWYEFCPTVIT